MWTLAAYCALASLGAMQLFRLRSDILTRLPQEAQRAIHALETSLDITASELRGLGKVGRTLLVAVLIYSCSLLNLGVDRGCVHC